MDALGREETQRVMAVLKSAVSNIRAVSHIPTAPDEALVKLIGDAGVREALQAYWQLEEGRDAVVEKSSVPAHLSVTARMQAQHSVSTRRLCRSVVSGSDLMATLEAAPTGYRPSEGLGVLVEALNGLIQVHDKSRPPLTSPTAATDLAIRPSTPDPETIRAISLRLEKASADISELEEELSRVKSQRESEVSQLDKELSELTEELLLLKKTAREEENELAKTTTAVQEESKTGHEERQEGLEKEYEKLRALSDETEASQLKEAAALRKRVDILTKDSRTLITEYDTKMGAMQEEMDDIASKREDESKVLAKLVDHFRLIDTNKKLGDAEEMEFQRMLKERQDKKDLIATAGALPIQRWFRSMKAEAARKEAESKKSKGKKGKKGKK